MIVIFPIDFDLSLSRDDVAMPYARAYGSWRAATDAVLEEHREMWNEDSDGDPFPEMDYFMEVVGDLDAEPQPGDTVRLVMDPSQYIELIAVEVTA